MADTLSPSERSARMALIRSKNTKPELLVRKAVWAGGFRYRLHVRGLPGRPDVVFPSLGVVVFVHGCYWHGHSCQKGRVPGANSAFWQEKFASNKARDRRNRARLRREGWKVVVVWECSLSTIPKRAKALGRLLDFLRLARQDTN
jgi:DNA mismatch endonuclease (patch repair protein)